MKLYHGTTVESARRIKREGFKYGVKYNWAGKIKSKKGYIYLSLAYAPFYAMAAKSSSSKRAIVKVEVNKKNLYPDEDFLFFTSIGMGVRDPKFDLSQYKRMADMSLRYLGNVCALPKDIKVVGVREFDAKRLFLVCDPTITPINYQIMGRYYRKLTEWIFSGRKVEEFDLHYNKLYDPQMYKIQQKILSKHPKKVRKKTTKK